MDYGGGVMNSFSDIPNISNVQLYKSWTEDKMELVKAYENIENHTEVFFSRIQSYLHNPNECNTKWIWNDHEFIVDPATSKIEEVSAPLMGNEEGITQSIIEEEEKVTDELDTHDFFISEDEVPADLMTETDNEIQDLDAYQLNDDEENASEGFDVEGFFKSDDNPIFEETIPADLSAGVDMEVSESPCHESTVCRDDEENSSVEADAHDFSSFEENSVSEEDVSIEIVEDAEVNVDEEKVCQIETEDNISIEDDVQDFSIIEESLVAEMQDDAVIEDETFQIEVSVEEEEELADDAENGAENEGILIQYNEMTIAVINQEEISIDTVSSSAEEIAITEEVVEKEDNDIEIEKEEEEDYDDSEDDEITVQSNDETMDYEGVNESEEEEGEEDFSNPDSGSDSQDSQSKKHSWEYINQDSGVKVKHLNHLMGRVWEKIGDQTHHFRIFEFSVT